MTSFGNDELHDEHWPSSANARLPPRLGAEQIMSMPVLEKPPRKWTAEEFYAARDAAPQGKRWELVDGEVLVTPGPHWSHQRIVLRLYRLLLAA